MSTYNGISNPQQEAIWAAQLAEARANLDKAVSTSRFIQIRKNNEYRWVFKDYKKCSIDFGFARIDWEDELSRLQFEYDCDPGVILKRLFLCDQARKGLDASSEYSTMFPEKIKPYEDCSGLEYLKEWSDVRLVSTVSVGVQDVFITNNIVGGKAQVGGGLRSTITEWSKKSRARCEKHIRNCPDGSIKYFLTLTYPREFSNDGVRIKRDLSTMRKRLRRMGVRDDIWFLEFQMRGAPHFHLYLGQCPTGNLEKGIKACANAWYEIVGSGDPKHLKFTLGQCGGKNKPCLEIMRNPHAASYYAVKYVVKADQKKVPSEYLNVGRFWGWGGKLKPVYESYFARGYAACKAGVSMIALWKFAKFGGYVDKDLTLYSATLRGGSSGDWLEKLMQYSGWCPD